MKIIYAIFGEMKSISKIEKKANRGLWKRTKLSDYSYYTYAYVCACVQWVYSVHYVRLLAHTRALPIHTSNTWYRKQKWPPLNTFMDCWINSSTNSAAAAAITWYDNTPTTTTTTSINRMFYINWFKTIGITYS